MTKESDPLLSKEKKEIRKRMACLRHAIPTKDAHTASERAYHFIRNWELFRQANVILLYHSLPDELPTLLWLERIYPSKSILLPVVTGEQMELCLYRGKDSLCKGAYSIFEPAGAPYTEYDKIDLCFIPGVAFDHEGNRLGRGKGYYDRLLPQIKAPKTGLCYECQHIDHIPSEPHDIRMDYLVTEAGLFQSGKKEQKSTDPLQETTGDIRSGE